jgi:oligosaccharide repeat unit polymerase
VQHRWRGQKRKIGSEALTLRGAGTVRLNRSFRGVFWEYATWLAWAVLLVLVIPLGLWGLRPIALLSILLILASLIGMQRLVGLFALNRLAIPSLFYLIYISVILLPGFFIFADEITASRGRFLFGIESVLITVPLGIWIANLCFRFRQHETADYFNRPVSHETRSASSVRIYLVFLVIALILVVINLIETPVIPLVFLIRNPGEFLAAALLREDSFKLLDSHLTYAYYVVRGTVFPFLIMLSFGRYVQNKQQIWKRLFWVSLASGVLYASLTIEKSPVAAIFGLLIIFYYLYKGGKLGATVAVAGPIVFLAFPLTIVLLAYNGSEGGTFGAALQAIVARIFYGPAQVVYAYFEVFPAVVPFQHGASLLKLAYLLGWKTIDIPNVVGLYMTDGGDLESVSANGCFIGNFYADFGLPGVMIGGVLAGFLMQGVSVYFFRRPKTVVSLAAYAICAWAFGELVIRPLPTTLLSGGVTFALLLYWFFRVRANAHPFKNRATVIAS